MQGNCWLRKKLINLYKFLTKTTICIIYYCKESQKQPNRELLLKQGVTLLMQQGYHGTGLKDILDDVKIAKGSFYNYFGCKENFAAEVIQHYINPFINQLNGHLQKANNDAIFALQHYFNELIMELERSKF